MECKCGKKGCGNRLYFCNTNYLEIEGVQDGKNVGFHSVLLDANGLVELILEARKALLELTEYKTDC